MNHDHETFVKENRWFGGGGIVESVELVHTYDSTAIPSQWLFQLIRVSAQVGGCAAVR